MSLNDLIAELAELEKARTGESELVADLEPEPVQEPKLEPRKAKKIKQTARQRRLRAETPRPAVVARPERKPTAIDAPFLSGLKGVAAALAPGENLSSAIGAELRRVERLRLRARDAQNNDVTGLADRVGRRP
jgi:hypothetical protein